MMSLADDCMKFINCQMLLELNIYGVDVMRLALLKQAWEMAILCESMPD